MMANVLVAEVRKTSGRKVVRVLTGAIAAFTALYFVLAHVTAQQAQVTGMDVGTIPPVVWPHGLVTGVTQLLAPGFTGGIAAVVLASSLWVNEVRWRTLHLWLSRGVSRTQVLAAKALVLILPLWVVALAGTLTAGVTSAALGLISAGGLSAGQVDGAQILLSVLRLTVGLMPVAAMTLLIGVLLSSGAATLGVALGYVLLGEQLLGAGMALIGAGDAVRFLPVALASSLVLRGESMVVGAAQVALPTSATVAFVGSVVWTVLLVGGAVGALRRQDLTG